MLRHFKNYTTKVDIKLIAQLRKETECSMSKAKELLLKHNNDYSSALKDLQTMTINTQKLASRATTEGLVQVYSHPLGFHSSLVELNSETDFVAKSPLFVQLSHGIAQTAAMLEIGTGEDLIKPISVESLLQKNMITNESSFGEMKSVQEHITQVIGKLKENIQLRRGLVFNDDGTGLISGAYSHGGRVASIVVLKSTRREQVAPFAKKLAQHISGFAPLSIDSQPGVSDDQVLLKQQWLFGGGLVQEIIEKLAEEHQTTVEIVDFKRFECGEGIEKKVDNFAEEVMAQIKK